VKLTSNTEVTKLEAALTALVGATGIIHIGVGLMAEYQVLTLAGAGFIGGAGLFLAGPRLDNITGLETGFSRATLSGLVLPYTGYQFIAYYSIYGFTGSPVAAADKLVQTGVLVLASIYLHRKIK
jgi:hypothetical protein